jgi:hypothetical protein
MAKLSQFAQQFRRGQSEELITKFRIKDELRFSQEITRGKKPHGLASKRLVHAGRADGKTSGLVEFVGERLMILAPPARVAVIFPDLKMLRSFEEQFFSTFPRITRFPVLITVSNGDISQWRGDMDDVVEVYAEEMLKIPQRCLEELLVATNAVFVAGVGTLEHEIITVELNNW